ncbi:hypothetical protein QYM36_008226, partial [Artemia franciscana]
MTMSKLLETFMLIMVNGHDVSNVSHEEAVKVFQEAQEPIMVEVSRRSSSPNDPQGKKSSIKSNPSSCEDSRLRVVETSVQTDWIEMPIDLKTDYANKDPFGPENTLEGGFDEDIYDIFDQEMDYE